MPEVAPVIRQTLPFMLFAGRLHRLLHTLAGERISLPQMSRDCLGAMPTAFCVGM